MRLYKAFTAALAGLALLAFASSPAPAQQAGDTAAMLAERAVGKADAPVTVTEYFSLTCPLCAQFHNETYAALKAKYIDTGKVRFVYGDFPLDGVALRAAMLARCADPQRYAGLIQVLFKTQDNWARAGNPVGELAKIGRLAGIGEAGFNACQQSEALADGILTDRQAASAAGVQSTPTFEINGQFYPGARSIEEFSEILDPLLANN